MSARAWGLRAPAGAGDEGVEVYRDFWSGEISALDFFEEIHVDVN